MPPPPVIHPTRSHASQFGVGLSDTRVEQPPSAVQIPRCSSVSSVVEVLLSDPRLSALISGKGFAFPIPRSSDYQITRFLDAPSPRHPSHPIPVIPIWRGFERYSCGTAAVGCSDSSVFLCGRRFCVSDPRLSALISGKGFAFPITGSPDYQITRFLDAPSPRHPSHPIPRIPIWRGFERYSCGTAALGCSDSSVFLCVLRGRGVAFRSATIRVNQR